MLTSSMTSMFLLGVKRIMRTFGISAAIFALLSVALIATRPSWAVEDFWSPDRRAPLVFDVLRKGSKIGEHRIDFRRENDNLVVEVAIDLKVKVLFVTAFRYEHRNREIWDWETGELLSIDAYTYDNGKSFTVKGERTAEGFSVAATREVNGEMSDLSYVTDREIVSSTYWDPRLREQSKVLNTQTGKLSEITVTELPREWVEIGDSRFPATPYRLEGGLNIDIYYDDELCLAKLAFKAPKDQSVISGKLETHFQKDFVDVSMNDHPVLGRCFQEETPGMVSASARK